MATNNAFTAVGNLTNVELKEAKNGSSYAKARLSVSMGQEKESSWFSVICFQEQAQNLYNSWMTSVANEGKKSVRAMVTGKLEVSQYGDNNEKTSVTIVADEIGISTKYAVCTGIAQQQNSVNTNNVQTQTAPAQTNVPAPVAKTEQQVAPNDAPF